MSTMAVRLGGEYYCLLPLTLNIVTYIIWTSACSERETIAERDSVLAIPNGHVYVSMHAYSEDMLYP